MQDFLTGIAFFLIIEGLVYALAPRFLVEMARLLPTVPERQLRIFGLGAVVLGVALVWFVRR
ncbi:DUF2065 domain-containing protein [Rhizobium mongolense]|uniref:DUF2065 domain-containing protein n=1 Tax=Rhizobium gallicum bv. gallicum R602sp TaxID=1041138 RepID=A0A0B4X4X6_9HYPH|nr:MULTISPECIES: DUF2065 domain-containing protein [Rhizobium]AJD41770.1 hypothetical protein RGR602_CH02445 [Rhizobium gallicum bv. gallicum R602sp]NNH33154.1 DUF2065 domain-containing protein [Rhizobium sp. SEMIA 4085]TDW31900.1 hypothetical protein EV128_108227 [Rhizobium azibense]WFU85736.1 DUF2065 domain-containing protein [Rhizobium sp. CC1099]